MECSRTCPTALEELRPRKEQGTLNDRRLADWNAPLESFGLHARVVYAFLCTPVERADGRVVVAADFLDRETGARWRGEYARYANWLNSERDKIDRQVVHIRRASIGGAKKEGHQYRNVAAVLFKLLNEFIDRVPEPLLGDRWTEAARNHLALNALKVDQLDSETLREIPV